MDPGGHESLALRPLICAPYRNPQQLCMCHLLCVPDATLDFARIATHNEAYVHRYHRCDVPPASYEGFDDPNRKRTCEFSNEGRTDTS
jgi:hypothetical protein